MLKFGFPKVTGVYTHIIVHVDATRPSMNTTAAWIDRVHRSKGFTKGGYHVFIRRDGTVEWTGTGARLREIGTPGAHVGGCGPGWNARCLGVCMAGGVAEADGKTPENNMTEAQFASLKKVLGELWDATGVDRDHTIGHRDLIKMTNAAPKACPCFSVRSWLNEWEDEPALEWYDAFRDLFAALAKVFGPNRDRVLKVPKIHEVKAGETLWSISQTYGVPVYALKKMNPWIGADNMIKAGVDIQLLD